MIDLFYSFKYIETWKLPSLLQLYRSIIRPQTHVRVNKWMPRNIRMCPQSCYTRNTRLYWTRGLSSRGILSIEVVGCACKYRVILGEMIWRLWLKEGGKLKGISWGDQLVKKLERVYLSLSFRSTKNFNNPCLLGLSLSNNKLPQKILKTARHSVNTIL